MTSLLLASDTWGFRNDRELQADAVVAVAVDASSSFQALGSGVGSRHPRQPSTAQLSLLPRTDPAAHAQASDQRHAQLEAASRGWEVVALAGRFLINYQSMSVPFEHLTHPLLPPRAQEQGQLASVAHVPPRRRSLCLSARVGRTDPSAVLAV